MNFIQELKCRLKRSWRFLACIAVPLVLLPLVFIPDDKIVEPDGHERKATKYKTAYAILVMAIYWMMELAPLPVTSLFPLLLFPMLGVQDAYEVSRNYTMESNMIFLTGVIVALALEYCNLHRRVALGVMTLVGGSPVRLLLGVMLITSLLAMWVSATTCVTLMIPIVVAIIDEIHESPAVISKSEARRRSYAPSTMGATDADQYNDDISRRYSSVSANYNGDRRRSTVFENAALARINHRGSSPLVTAGVTRTPRQSMIPDSPFPKQNLPSNQSLQNSEYGAESQFPLRSKRISFLIKESRGSLVQPPQSQELSGSLKRPKAEDENANDFDKKSVSINTEIEIKEVNQYPHKFQLGSEMGENVEYIEVEMKEEQKLKDNIKTMFLFGLAYAANIGGTAVITGASPNKIFKEAIKQLDITQNGKYTDITFFMWMALNVPPMIVNVLVAWIYLVCTFYWFQGFKKWFCCGETDTRSEEDDPQIYKWKSREVTLFLKREYQNLGRIGYHEIAVGLIFVGVIILWIFRSPEKFWGWGDIYTGAKTGDSTGAMFGVVLLFILPKDWSFLLAGAGSEAQYEALLDWKFVATKMPWGVLLLLGSGFAISEAVSYSGLSEAIGERLEVLGEVSKPVLLLIVIVSTTTVTEVVSNVACANIILPVMISLSKSLAIHPLYLTVAATIACSYAFMLPVASPSNSLIYASGNFGTFQMFKTGLFLNIICTAVLYLNTVTYGNYLFDFDNYVYSNNTDPGIPHGVQWDVI